MLDNTISEKDTDINNMITALEEILANCNLDQEIQDKKRNISEWLHSVFAYIQAGKYTQAQEAFFKVLIKDSGAVDEEWINTDTAVMCNLFKIYQQEVQNGKESIFCNLKTYDDISRIYVELRFLVRRFEYDFPENLKRELLDFIETYSISEYAIIEMIQSGITQKEKVANEVAIFLLRNRKYEYVLPLLAFGYDLNPQNNETLYNLAYFLYAFNETELALEYMDSISERDSSAQKLYDIVRNGKKLPEYSKLHRMRWEEDPILPTVSKPETPQKISFIVCVNNQRYYQECCHYIHQLYVPEGYTIDMLPVYNAESITSAYQNAMEQSDGVYKIYLHQDVMCIRKEILYEALHIFEQDKKIGILGVAGCRKMDVSGVWWNADKKDRYYHLQQDKVLIYTGNSKGVSCQEYNCGDYQTVEALDGVFLMTSKDVEWRTDIFTGWHFYDVSQCMEFIRKGYKVVIPKTENPWVLHCEKYEQYLASDYHRARISYLKEYAKKIC